jgi:hypothetical protein
MNAHRLLRLMHEAATEHTDEVRLADVATVSVEQDD